MMVIFNTLFFLIVLIFYQFSIIGYGKLIGKYILDNRIKNENYDKLIFFFYGLISLNIIGFLLFIFSVTNIYLNIIILIFGFFNYFKFHRKLDKNDLIIILLLTIMFVGILISKTHEDYIPYHFSFIDIVSN